MIRRKNMDTNEKFVYFLRYGQFENAVEMIRSDDFDPNYEYILDKEYRIKGTALHAAIWNLGGYSQSNGEGDVFFVINELLQKGVDPNKKGSFGTVPLERAISYDLIKSTKLLFDNGAKMPETGTVLIEAIFNESAPMLDLLFENGASVSYKEPDSNQSLLEIAYEVNNPAVVGILLSKGANINERFVDADGKEGSFRERIVEDVLGKNNHQWKAEEKRNKRAILKLVQEFEKKEKGQKSEFTFLMRSYMGKGR